MPTRTKKAAMSNAKLFSESLTDAARAVLSSAHLSDVLGELGWKFQDMDARIRPVVPLPLSGCAFPVSCYPGATWAMERAVEEAPSGSVIVADGRGFEGAVLMGGLMSLRAGHRGVIGAIVNAAVRDVSELKTRAFGVWAAAACPASGTHAELGWTQLGVCCGGGVVTPGDWVFADEDGIVVVPERLLEKALDAVESIARREDRITELLGRGLSLKDAFTQSVSDGADH